MTILVPIDASAPSRAAVRVAAGLAKAQDDALVILHVHSGPHPASLDILARLHELAAPARERGVSVRLRVVRGAVVDQICAWSRRPGVRMVVTGTRGQKPSSADTHESVARVLMKCSPVPVVAVRPGDDGLGTVDGPIQVIAVPGSVTATVALQLSRVWQRPTVEAQVTASPQLVDTTLVRRSDVLTVMPFDPDCEWADWCVEFMEQARGALALVGGEGCGCEVSGGPFEALARSAR